MELSYHKIGQHSPTDTRLVADRVPSIVCSEVRFVEVSLPDGYPLSAS
jgi:hypothetical protein